MFRAKLDSSTGAVKTANDGTDDYRVKSLVSSIFGQRSIFIGMRETMSTSFWKYYIHCIYYRIDT